MRKMNCKGAETRVRSLFFQLSIVKGKGEDDLIFAIKLLGAARSETEYLNAYNFALAVAMRCYGDSRHERRSGKKSLKSNRSIVKGSRSGTHRRNRQQPRIGGHIKWSPRSVHRLRTTLNRRAAFRTQPRHFAA